MNSILFFFIGTSLFLFANAGTPSCSEYCSAVNSACIGNYTQYTSEAACMSICADLPLGTDDTAVSGDTVGCRTYHAGLAVSQPNPHCLHAGATGGNTCGTYCQSYCDLAMNGCVGYNTLYSSYATCLDICSNFSLAGSWLPISSSGATLQCRSYHVALAISLPNVNLHCPHASPSGGTVCGSYCQNYCIQIMGACPTEYLNVTECQNYCSTIAGIPSGNWNDTSGNSVTCRTYHSDFVLSGLSATVHCPHAGKSGGNVCGTWCDNYCQLTGKNCPSLYANLTACYSACGQFSNSGLPDATSGNSVQCRIYHAGLAGQGPSYATIHCPHASISGGGVCVSSTTTGPMTTTGTPMTTTGTPMTTTGTPMTTATKSSAMVVFVSFALIAALFIVSL